MKISLIRSALILLSIIPYILKGESPADSVRDHSYYHISEGQYIENDSITSLDNWVDKGMNILFVPVRDSLIISIDIGGKDKIFFMGMAVRIENPGFDNQNKDAEFYHWIFTSHIKEGIRNAFISKEYIRGSLEKYGLKGYLIQIHFFDKSEFLFYASELKPNIQVKQ
ncbi:MAG: hypothetical protein A2X05_08210 [Bacteroidetes bacterium GWE2_41_25]|nr:MAG: hypothetical protein A2X03_00460 [Bacteroidetes bacterium GWA2_40_15]OFX93340.1 MAG: hypothetical protein A2X05_08210 [Bacteroidetes bacterium GWE2_41_25]OFX97795.1 MAG: hypothetical protein A2X06_06065 [Bacteroidetes bacterium GWC2_40_22]HBH83778.1 hypothetical protein [Bacteroidales bacterium]HBQ84663.1 hypothetical protein [Bacteroidales bacterium]